MGRRANRLRLFDCLLAEREQCAQGSVTPAANRTLIAFGGWANLAHAGLMAAQEYKNVMERRELAGVADYGLIGSGLALHHN